MSLAIYALVGSGALIFHIAIGYPLILAVWKGRGPRVNKDEEFVTTVSVVMAVYNGGALIRRKLEALLLLDYPRDLLQIIVISDGSTDETGAIVHEFENSGVVLLTVPRGGKAAALNRGLEAACGEILFFTDVRQPLEPKCLRHLVANFADPQGLQQTGNTQWVQSYASGAPVHGAAGGSGFGNIQSGALEDSNVDITSQLVDMITAQRAFQSNAQMISTEDQLTQDIINIPSQG